MSNELSLAGISFKAYLEDSDMFYEMKDQQLPFAPTSFRNDSAMIRVLERAKFTFNVFSESKTECIENYKNLQKLLINIKPSYGKVYDQYVPANTNITGYFNVKFAGIPRGNIDLHLTSFTYNINKDLGYLEVDNGELSKGQKGSKLIPISYKISIEGKVLLEFTETTNAANIGFTPAPVVVAPRTATPVAPAPQEPAQPPGQLANLSPLNNEQQLYNTLDTFFDRNPELFDVSTDQTGKTFQIRAGLEQDDAIKARNLVDAYYVLLANYSRMINQRQQSTNAE